MNEIERKEQGVGQGHRVAPGVSRGHRSPILLLANLRDQTQGELGLLWQLHQPLPASLNLSLSIQLTHIAARTLLLLSPLLLRVRHRGPGRFGSC
jgi:hypothetical protein